MTPEKGLTVVEVLKRRCGEWTNVYLENGEILKALNIAWGYDRGDEYAHITTNISPSQDDSTDIDFFYANEVMRLEDADTGKIVWSVEKETA